MFCEGTVNYLLAIPAIIYTAYWSGSQGSESQSQLTLSKSWVISWAVHPLRLHLHIQAIRFLLDNYLIYNKTAIWPNLYIFGLWEETRPVPEKSVHRSCHLSSYVFKYILMYLSILACWQVSSVLVKKNADGNLSFK